MYTNPVEQSELVECLIERALLGDTKTTMTGIAFMQKYSEEEQWTLCRSRILSARDKILEIMEKENWPCIFPVGNHIYFNNTPSDKILFNRLAITIGPDTYSSYYMETALLQKDARDFIDDHEYVDQDTKMFQTFDTLIEEIRRIIDVYKTLYL